MQVVKDIALSPGRLNSMKATYLTSFVATVAKMKIDDEEIWGALAAYLVEHCEQFDERDLSTQVYSLQLASKHKPIILNFDDIFKKYELQLVKKLEAPGVKPQSISNTILSYSKSQNGSIPFF